jgi:hypothetical protein
MDTGVTLQKRHFFMRTSTPDCLTTVSRISTEWKSSSLNRTVCGVIFNVRIGKDFGLKNSVFYIRTVSTLLITECWSFYFLNPERKLFSVIRMSKEPSQLHNMVKQRNSSRRGVIFVQRYTYLCFFYNKDILINVGTFR